LIFSRLHSRVAAAQGRYDVVTPLHIAWDLKEAWPAAGFIIVTDSNQSIDEPDMATELVRPEPRLRAKLR
jgi:proline iminopeptidase